MKLTSGSVSSPLVRRLEDAAGKHSVARQRKLAKRSASSYPLLWGEFCRDSWQGKEYGKTWTRKDLAIFRRSLESYPSLDVRNYLQVCVENWKEIAQQCFAWLKDTTIPPFPQPGFFTRHHKTFLNAYLRYRDNGVFIIASRKLAEKKEVNTELADLRAENAKLKAAVSRQSSTVNAVRHPPEKKIKIKIKSGMAKRVGLTEWE